MLLFKEGKLALSLFFYLLILVIINMKKVARIYMRVSTAEQSLARQEALKEKAINEGYYIAGVYAEKASAAKGHRAELQRLIDDLQEGDVIIAERLDRITRLTVEESKALFREIEAKGARVSVPDLDSVNLTAVAKNATGIEKIVLDAVQKLLWEIVFNTVRVDYEERRRRQQEGIVEAKKKGIYKGRSINHNLHQRIIYLKIHKVSSGEIAKIVGCHRATVNRVWGIFEKNPAEKIKSLIGSNILEADDGEKLLRLYYENFR